MKMFKRALLLCTLLISSLCLAQMEGDADGGVELDSASGFSNTITSNVTTTDDGPGFDPPYVWWSDVFTSGPMIDDGAQHPCFAAGTTTVAFNGGDIWSTLATNVSFSAANAGIKSAPDGILLGFANGKLYQLVNGQMVQKAAPAGVTGLAVASAGRIYVTGPTVSGKNIYQYNKSNNTWTQPIPGVVSELGVADDDGALYAINASGQPVRLINNVWTTTGPLPAGVTAEKLVTLNGVTLYVLGSNNVIYNYTALNHTFSPVFGTPPAGVTDIAIYNNGMYVMTSANTMYRYVAPSWKQITGSGVRKLAVGGSFDIYIVNGNGNVVRRLPNDTKRFLFNAASSDGSVLNYRSHITYSNLPNGTSFPLTSTTTIHGSYCSGLTDVTLYTSLNISGAFTFLASDLVPPYGCHPLFPGSGTQICLQVGHPFCSNVAVPRYHPGGVDGTVGPPPLGWTYWDLAAVCLRQDAGHPWQCAGAILNHYSQPTMAPKYCTP